MKITIAVLLGLFTSIVFADGLSVIIKQSEIEKTLEDAGKEVVSQNLAKNSNLIPYKSVMEDFFRDNLSYSVFASEVKDIYRSEFSGDEIEFIASKLSSVKTEHELMLFYGSDLGQRLLNVFSKVDSEILTKAALIAGDPDSGVEAAVTEAYFCQVKGEC